VIVAYGIPWLTIAGFAVVFLIGLLTTFTRTDWKI
jgi:hypothetical protein